MKPVVRTRGALALLAVLAFAVGTAPPAVAQAVYGSIAGSVLDTTGAVTVRAATTGTADSSTPAGGGGGIQISSMRPTSTIAGATRARAGSVAASAA